MKNLIKKIMPVLIALAIVCLGTIGILIYKAATRVTVNFDLVIADYVENSENFEPVKIWKNKTLKLKEIPEIPFGTFAGWLVCDEKAGMIPFDESIRIKENTTLVANWTIDETDSDGDGVADVLEKYFGTNPNSVDSDGDGFSDYIELMAGTDPNKYCSEAESKELQAYIPFDFELDTDGDGASDAWEREHGTSIISYDNSFYAIETCEDYSGALRATVYVELDGKQVDSLNVSTVSTMDCPYVSSAIAGYMGQAFEFSVDGSFDTATIEFEYDRYEFGRISDSFLPQIYYVNEKTGKLELLPDQKVENGLVSATVHHFSKYILLNKVEFDKVWEKAVLSPSMGRLGNDVVFLMDNSASMADNDGEKYRYTIVNSFNEQFSSCHRTAIIYYELQSHVLSPLGTDRSEYAAMLNGLTVDKGTDMMNSGSSSISALRKAMEMYDTFSRKKIVVLMSDGRDSGGYKEDAVTKVIEELKAAGVIVFTVGFGDVDETVLKRYAEETGGAYMYVQNEDEAKVFAASITDNDDSDSLTDDLNGDKLPDFYARLLSEGEMALSNGSYELKGVDFTDPDIDGDGLLNGEEIVISGELKLAPDDNYALNRISTVYANKISDPTKSDSDGDGFFDGEDSKPLVFNLDKGLIDALRNSENFACDMTYAALNNDQLSKSGIKFLTFVSSADIKSAYQNALLEYYLDWGSDIASLHDSADSKLKIYRLLMDVLDGKPMSFREDASTYMSTISAVNDLLLSNESFVNWAQTHSKELSLILDEGGRVTAKGKILTQMEGYNSVIGNIGDMMTAAFTVRDMAACTILVEEISTCSEYFYSGMDLLDKTLLRTEDENLKSAIRSVKLALSDKASAVLEANLEVLKSTAISMVVDQALDLYKPAKAVVAIVQAAVTAMKTADEMENLHMITLYRDMSGGAIFMLNGYAYASGDYYVLKDFQSGYDVKTALVHLGRARMLGEDALFIYVEGKEGDATYSTVSNQIRNVAVIMDLLRIKQLKGSNSEGINGLYTKYGVKWE